MSAVLQCPGHTHNLEWCSLDSHQLPNNTDTLVNESSETGYFAQEHKACWQQQGLNSQSCDSESCIVPLVHMCPHVLCGKVHCANTNTNMLLNKSVFASCKSHNDQWTLLCPFYFFHTGTKTDTAETGKKGHIQLRFLPLAMV